MKALFEIVKFNASDVVTASAPDCDNQGPTSEWEE